MKYIIDVPDGTKWIEAYYTVDYLRYQGDTIMIDSLTPYTEPDRKAIEDEVWEFARKMVSTSGNEVSEMWGCATNFGEVMHNTTYSEAKAKYEEWKSKDEIRVGDEVTLSTNEKLVVVTIDGTSAQGIDENGECYESIFLNELTKTGRHFNEIEELLKKMRDTDED